MKERKCSRCAWFGGDGLCHYEPERLAVLPNYWCRHWSETTGWDVFEKRPSVDLGVEELKKELKIAKGLLRIASELFEKELEVVASKGDIHLTELLNPAIRSRWLEEYRAKC